MDKADKARACAPEDALAPTPFIDSDHPLVVALAARATAGLSEPRQRAVALYDAVRDEVRYDPYRIEHSRAGFRASRCLETGQGFCITKAVLLAAAARAASIPARLGFADVRNHLTTAKLAQSMGTDLFVFHGYAELWLDGRWVKATPAFNLSLCEKFGVKPLAFDGASDSVFQPFDTGTGRGPGLRGGGGGGAGGDLNRLRDRQGEGPYPKRSRYPP